MIRKLSQQAISALLRSHRFFRLGGQHKADNFKNIYNTLFAISA